MSEWAARLGLVFPDKARTDFDQFVDEVNNDNVEYLALRKQFDESKETKPTYEQISQERILDEANKNILVLKSLETILQERTQSYTTFFAAQGKYKPSFEIFQYCEGSLRQALDALFVFVEQVQYMPCMLADLDLYITSASDSAQKSAYTSVLSSAFFQVSLYVHLYLHLFSSDTLIVFLEICIPNIKEHSIF